MAELKKGVEAAQRLGMHDHHNPELFAEAQKALREHEAELLRAHISHQERLKAQNMKSSMGLDEDEEVVEDDGDDEADPREVLQRERRASVMVAPAHAQ